VPAYAIAHLHNPRPHPEIIEYLERIQDTLDPYRGRFLVHGGRPDVLEEPWPGTVVVLEFPDIDAAHAWYRSPAYQAILPLRTGNIDGRTIIIDGVPEGYHPSRAADAMRAALD
jgi:uncharacterized protein (DUF1330 family)